jgi:hypothetical protein
VTENESVVLNALQERSFVEGLWEVGMVEHSKIPALAVSPDGVALVYFGEPRGREVFSVEIKTRVAETTQDGS